MASDRITHFGRTNSRNSGVVFGIKQRDRLSHMLIIGKTGTGKSTLIETLIRQDLAAGRGFALIDPHGDLVELVWTSIAEHRRSEVVYLNVPDPAQPYGYNPLRHVREDKIALAASGLLDAFKKIWGDAWGVRMEHILRNALFALLEHGDATLPDILRLISDSSFRRKVAEPLKNEPVRNFWLQEFSRYSFVYQ